MTYSGHSRFFLSIAGLHAASSMHVKGAAGRGPEHQCVGAPRFVSHPRTSYLDPYTRVESLDWSATAVTSRLRSGYLAIEWPVLAQIGPWTTGIRVDSSADSSLVAKHAPNVTGSGFYLCSYHIPVNAPVPIRTARRQEGRGRICPFAVVEPGMRRV